MQRRIGDSKFEIIEIPEKYQLPLKALSIFINFLTSWKNWVL